MRCYNGKSSQCCRMHNKKGEQLNIRPFLISGSEPRISGKPYLTSGRILNIKKAEQSGTFLTICYHWKRTKFIINWLIDCSWIILSIPDTTVGVARLLSTILVKNFHRPVRIDPLLKKYCWIKSKIKLKTKTTFNKSTQHVWFNENLKKEIVNKAQKLRKVNKFTQNV